MGDTRTDEDFATTSSASCGDESSTDFKDEKKYVCSFDDCVKSFSRYNRLLQHERVHTGEKPFKCKVKGCTHSYARSSHLKRHVQQTHELIRTPADVVICDVDGCFKTFVSKDNLKRHEATVHNQTFKKYPCKIDGCGKFFSKRYQLRHHEFEHKGVEPFQCFHEGCKRKFSQKSHLQRHLKTHDGYKCDMKGCNEVFETWSQLRKHKSLRHKKSLRKTHSGSETEIYEVDSMETSQNNTGHNFDGSNSGVKRFKCKHDGCDRAYSTRFNLNLHVQVGHDKRYFECDKPGCGKNYSTRQKLQFHQESKCSQQSKSKRKACAEKPVVKKKLDISEICKNFENLNNPFVYLNRINPLDETTKLLGEEHRLTKQLGRIRRKINRQIRKSIVENELIENSNDVKLN